MDTPQSHSKIVSMIDKIMVHKENGPGGATNTVNPGPNHRKGVAMSRVSEPETKSRQGIARDYLSLSREHVERSKSLRLHYMRLGRNYGLTNQEIGDLLGLTEARVRQMLRAE